MLASTTFTPSIRCQSIVLTCAVTLVVLSCLVYIRIIPTNIGSTFKSLLLSQITNNVAPDRTKVKPNAKLADYVRPSFMNISFPSTHSDRSLLFPRTKNKWEDRIFNQLTYKPNTPPKTIKIIYAALSKISIPRGSNGSGRTTFLQLGCHVTQCSLTTNPTDVGRADLLVLSERHNHSEIRRYLSGWRRPGQISALVSREIPQQIKDPFMGGQFNWTISYQPWSTVPYLYGKLYRHRSSGAANSSVSPKTKTHKITKGKRGKVVAFISNCRSKNNRLQYVQELSKYIDVHLYGSCGKRLPTCEDRTHDCMKSIIKRHKFYLSFENANCESYVTEKYFNNAIRNDVLPIVMGASPAYYRQISPPHSFIHVDDFLSLKHLASYLNKLDQNDILYGEYFRWKNDWQFLPDGEVWCRICALLHAPSRSIHTDLKQWKLTEKCD